MARLLMPNKVVGTFKKLLIYFSQIKQSLQSLKWSEKRKHPVISLCENAQLMYDVNGNSKTHSLQPRFVEEHF